MSIRVVDIPDDPQTRLTVARWSVAEWSHTFPDDTVDTYLDLFEAADAHPGELPVVLVAIEDGRVVGTASLVDDDELPLAAEPGPWVAAVFVDPLQRGRGVGSALVRAALERARELGFARVFLYTQTGADWYGRMGWERVRNAALGDANVTVLSRLTSD